MALENKLSYLEGGLPLADS